jgi:RNA polymerase sigma-70 factor, ECF subfamily
MGTNDPGKSDSPLPAQAAQGGLSRSKEQKLIKAAARGDIDAASALIRAYQGGVYAYIRKLCGHDDIAEDVTQEAFSRVLLNLDRFDDTYRFSTWLFTIARRVYFNMREKKRPTPDTDRLAECFAKGGERSEVGDGLEAGERQSQCKDLLQRALLALAPEQREIVVLFHQHDWPIWMIAEQLGCPEGTVKSHLFRGRLKLRDEYLRLEAQSQATAAAAKQAAHRAAAATLSQTKPAARAIAAARVQIVHAAHGTPAAPMSVVGGASPGGIAPPPGMRAVPVNAKSAIFESLQPGDAAGGTPVKSGGRSAQDHSNESDDAAIAEELSKSGIFTAIQLRKQGNPGGEYWT